MLSPDWMITFGVIIWLDKNVDVIICLHDNFVIWITDIFWNVMNSPGTLAILPLEPLKYGIEIADIFSKNI